MTTTARLDVLMLVDEPLGGGSINKSTWEEDEIGLLSSPKPESLISSCLGMSSCDDGITEGEKEPVIFKRMNDTWNDM